LEKIKKVLVITGWFPNEFETSKGVFTKKIVEAQLKYTNCLITVICPVPYFPKINLSFIPQKFRNFSKIKYSYLNNGYKIYYPKYFKFPSPLSDKIDWYNYYKAAARTIRKEKIEFDIIHSHGLFPDSYSAALISEQFHKPLVVHVHDSFINLIYEKFPRKINFISKIAAKLLPVSRFQAKMLTDTLKEANIENKIEVIYNGVDLDIFKIKPAEERESNSFQIVFVGNNYKNKGLPILLEAIANLKGKYKIKLDIVGEGSDKEEMIELVQGAGLDDFVNFKGNISNNILAEQLPGYNLLVLPSEFETFGIVLIEALACGIPVISTNITAIPEIVSDDEIGILITPGSVEELTEAIKKAINKHWNKRYMREHAMKFSLQETAKNIDKIYDQIL
jgi:glycosyltransferase involved in cell wall biosynthesis